MMKELMKKKRNNKGFSLVELIVVVLIIAIIAVALAPQVMKWVGTSRENVDENNASSIKSATLVGVAEFVSKHNTEPTFNEPLNTIVPFPVGTPTTIEDYISNAIGNERPKTSNGTEFTIDVNASGVVTVSWINAKGVEIKK